MDIQWQLRDTHLQQRISTFNEGGGAFIVGITANPEGRVPALEEGGEDYDEMLILYQTRSKSEARRLRQELGENFDGYTDPRGRGRVEGPPFYVYLCQYAAE